MITFRGMKYTLNVVTLIEILGEGTELKSFENVEPWLSYQLLMTRQSVVYLVGFSVPSSRLGPAVQWPAVLPTGQTGTRDLRTR